MFNVKKEKNDALVKLHGWSAVFLGLLLYAVVITGTVAVLSEEILHWSVGHVKADNPTQADLDKAIAKLSPQVKPEYLEEIGVGHTSKGDLQLFFHTHRTNEAGQVEEFGTRYSLDPVTLDVLTEKSGTGAELFQTDEDSALSRFLVSVHTELHLPRPWGLLLTGILGLAMLVAAISGLIMHRALLRDMFVIRSKSRNEQLPKRDMHTVAGSWGLPFAFILAFTGSFFSFAGAFGIPAMAMVAFGGDQELLIRTVIGAPETESDTPASTASVNAIVQDAVSRTGNYPEFVSVSHYGLDNAKITVFSDAAEGDLEPIQFEYNGVSGEFVRQKPALGLVPSVGSVAFSLIGPLHFGNFAGLLSKFVWLSLGIASCYVIASGLRLWVIRRQKESQWLTFGRYVSVFIYGLPISMLMCAVAYFAMKLLSGNVNWWVPASFVISGLILLLLPLIFKNQLEKAMVKVCGALCISVVALRILTGGPFWIEAALNQQSIVVMMDILLLICAGLCFYLKPAQVAKNEPVPATDSKQEVVTQ